MSTVTTKDDTRIFCMDWGPKGAQPIVFHHGWPLSSDDWDAQMLFFLGEDHYTANAAAVVEHLALRDAVHVGHSIGGGEATRYAARHGKGRVAKLVLTAHQFELKATQ